MVSHTTSHTKTSTEESFFPRTPSVVPPGQFEPVDHFYPRVVNATIHPVVRSFLNLSRDQLIKRYCHLRPQADKQRVAELLGYVPKNFFWAGTDLFNVTNEFEKRQMIVIETNSCPSGQKSMPNVTDDGDLDEASGYTCLAKAFATLCASKSLPEGKVAVVYDKNHMEATGYAAKIADMLNEPVYKVEFYDNDPSPPVKWVDGVMLANVSGEWIPIRACFRYVTQKPWNRFPINTKTFVFNSILSCLSGGRNKLVGSKAYELLNAELSGTGLEIRTPETIHDVGLAEIPMYVKSMGYHAVVKNPYSNAGQGVYTLCSKEELDAFMALEHHYDKFIVQSLVGNSNWSSKTSDKGTYYHVGTIPNRKNDTYVFDLRMMVCADPGGFIPLAIYGRKAAKPLSETLDTVTDSWSMLGTNLSVKLQENVWGSDSSRLVLMDRKDFNQLGISIDDLIDGFVQTVLASIAVDKMAGRLKKEDSTFDMELFSSLNHDETLVAEVLENGNWEKVDGVVTK